MPQNSVSPVLESPVPQGSYSRRVRWGGMTVVFGALSLVLGSGFSSGCAGKKKQQHSTNEELMAQFAGEEYADDVVSVHPEQHEDQGQAVSAEAQLAVQDSIQEVYLVDFENCLEEEMDRLENRYVAGDFTIELHIGTDGRVSRVKFIEEDVRERRVAEGATPKKAKGFAECIRRATKEWEFSPAPEAAYVHTYSGRVGEAW